MAFKKSYEQLYSIAEAVDFECTTRLDDMEKAQVGGYIFAADGVTALGRNYVLLTRTLGKVTRFTDIVQLGHQVHDHGAEVAALKDRIMAHVKPGAAPVRAAVGALVAQWF